MSNQNEFEYIEAKEFLHLPVIEISNVKSFTRFANSNDIKYIFKVTGNEKIEFFFPHAGIVYKIMGDGFQTLADMQQSQNGNFPDSKEYYKAKKLDISSYSEYKGVNQAGEENKEEYAAAREGGFVKGFDQFHANYEQYLEKTHKDIIPTGINDALKLYQYALKKGIKTYGEFENIYKAGYVDQLTYADGQAKGFSNGSDYRDAHKRGFTDPKEYQDAMKRLIESKKEYDEYRHLNDLNQKYLLSYDKIQLLIALSNCENGKVVSLAEARKLLQEAQQKLLQSTGREKIPLWYSRSIDQEDKLVEFLKTKNEELRKFGFFNTAKNSFEIFKASAIRIFIDGSNVAHNSKGDKVKPEIKNIRLTVKELNFWKFKNVTVITDASLKHRVKDLNALDALKKECEYLEAPAKTSADEFLIASVKKQKCLLVSNDTFEDWKKKDKWVKDKIDSIRVPFVITKEDHVILKGLEEFRERLVGE